MPTATMSQIADLAGVSQATVSFVLNERQRNGGSIGEATAKRVQDVAQELGYRPNRTARALATGKSNLIGLAMWNLSAAHYANVTRQMEEKLRHSSKHLLVSCLQGERSEADPQLLESTFPWPLDGVLALEAGNVLRSHWDKFGSWPAPLVSMGGTTYEVSNLDYVGIDLAQGVRQAVEHLIEVGCRRIAFAALSSSLKNKELRLMTYEKTMQKHNREVEYLSLKEVARSKVREEIKEHFSSPHFPDGLLCFNDEIAISVYRGLRDLNVSVPQQVALIGCDGIEDTEYLECPITTIVQPVAEMCGLAWDMLQNRIRSPDEDFQQKVLLPQLAVRESTSSFSRISKGGVT